MVFSKYFPSKTTKKTQIHVSELRKGSRKNDMPEFWHDASTSKPCYMFRHNLGNIIAARQLLQWKLRLQCNDVRLLIVKVTKVNDPRQKQSLEDSAVLTDAGLH
eukprot:6193922-Karenia_brevis.AAC.1